MKRLPKEQTVPNKKSMPTMEIPHGIPRAESKNENIVNGLPMTLDRTELACINLKQAICESFKFSMANGATAELEGIRDMIRHNPGFVLEISALNMISEADEVLNGTREHNFYEEIKAMKQMVQGFSIIDRFIEDVKNLV